jgi:uncharacterized membrane-anchored protein
VAGIVLFLSPALGWAQGPGQQSAFGLPSHLKGPCTGDMGLTTIKVPAGYHFVPRSEMDTFNRRTGNPPQSNDIGAMYNDDTTIIIFFNYTGDGYVKDTDKDKIDADALLETFKEGTNQANEWRKQNNEPILTLVGWETKPFYDDATHNLTWALRNTCQGVDGINHESRLLGRGGFTSATLVCSPAQLAQGIKTYNDLLKGFSYKPGQKYSEFNPSTDKVAAYTVGGLATVGLVALAAKSGILAKFGKFIIVGIVALFGGIAAFFRRLFGGKSASTT